MKLNIIPVYEYLDDYILEIEKGGTDCEKLWDKYAIQPYWDKISEWAPFDMSDRKPRPIKDVVKLKQQIKLLKEIDIDKLNSEFMKAVEKLLHYDDDTVTVAIYPLDDEDTTAKEKQNGVAGVSVFGNILINVNPLAVDYLEWIPYVFAHEYHHSVWGNYWYVLHGEPTGTLLESLLIDGQADAFAKSLNPKLNPAWISQLPEEQEKELWDKYYSKLLYETDFDYVKYMFGDKAAGIPWCAGYFFGYRIIDSLKKKYPEVDAKSLIEMNSEEIFKMSGYGKLS
jgi:uncharacterized protein YjaZ